MSRRPSLSNFAPKRIDADGANIIATAEAIPSAAKKYPKISVYLTADEVRTLKLLGVENNQRLSDIAATAVRDWMERNGHARGKIFKA
jgi:hypothetical protein